MSAEPADDEAMIAGGRLPRRLSLVTLGVSDVAAARAFYERLGFEAADFDSPEVCFFETKGTAFGLYGRQALAEDAAVSHEGDGFRATSLALNLDSEAAVDAALAFAQSCGATITKPAERVFWGGYSGYFADPDGHLWEVAYNPVFELDRDGRVQFPPPKRTETTR